MDNTSDRGVSGCCLDGAREHGMRAWFSRFCIAALKCVMLDSRYWFWERRSRLYTDALNESTLLARADGGFWRSALGKLLDERTRSNEAPVFFYLGSNLFDLDRNWRIS